MDDGGDDGNDLVSPSHDIFKMDRSKTDIHNDQLDMIRLCLLLGYLPFFQDRGHCLAMFILPRSVIRIGHDGGFSLDTSSLIH